MSKTKPTPPSGSTQVGAGSVDYDSFELEPGEAFTGRLVTTSHYDGDYGASCFATFELTDAGHLPDFEEGDLVELFARSGLKRAYNDDELQRGGSYWVCKDTDVSEVNGNEFYEIEVRSLD